MKVFSYKNRPLCATSPKEMNARLFAHIHLDSSILGTHLEGEEFIKTSAYVEKMLEYVLRQDLFFKDLDEAERLEFARTVKKMSEDFKVLREIQDELEKTVKKVKALRSPYQYPTQEELNKQYCKPLSDLIFEKLESNGSVLIPGGWSGVAESGHRMCYQIIKNKNGYQFIVYNTGAGIEHHLNISKFKNSYSPIMAFQIPKEVTEEQLKKYITSLMDPRIKPHCEDISGIPDIEGRFGRMEPDTEAHKYWKEHKRVYDANRVYKEVISKICNLGATEIDPKEISLATTKGQLGGTCAMRVLMPLLHFSLKGKLFSHSLYQLRLQSIIDYFSIEKTRDNLSHSTVQRSLNKAIAQLAKTTEKFMKRKKNKVPIISESLGNENLNILKEIQEELKLHVKQQEVTPLEPFVVDEQLTNTEKIKTVNRRKQVDTKLLKLSDQKKEQEALVFKPKKNLPDKKEYSNVKDYFNAIFEILSYNDGLGLSETVLHQVEQLFFKMPLNFKENQDFFQDLKKEDARDVLTIMQDIMRMYGKNCFRVSPYPLPRQILTANTILYNTSFIMKKHFENIPQFGNLASLLPLIGLSDVQATSIDPIVDERLGKLNDALVELDNLEKSNLDLLKKDEKAEHGLIPKDSILSMGDFYDISFLKQLDSKILQELSNVKNNYTNDSLDNARQNLYMILKDEVKRKSLSQDLNKVLDEYSILLQFKMMSQESKLFSRGEYPYFEGKFSAERTASYLECRSVREKRYCVHPFSYKTEYNYSFGIQNRWLSKSMTDYLKISPPFRGYYNKDETPDSPETEKKRVVEKLLFDQNYNTGSESNRALRAIIEDYSANLPQTFPKRAIAMTRISSTENRALITRDYFESNPEMLSDKESQSLFLINVFGREVNQHNKKTPFHLIMKRNSNFINELIKLMIKGFKFHSQNNEITEGTLFCYQLTNELLKYLKSMPTSESKVSHEAIAWLEGLDEKLDKDIDNYKHKLEITPNDTEINDYYQELLNIKFIREGILNHPTLSFGSTKNLFESLLNFQLESRQGKQNSYTYTEFLNFFDINKENLRRHFQNLNGLDQERMVKELIHQFLVPDVCSDLFAVKIDYPAVWITDKNNKSFLLNLERGNIVTQGTRLGKIPKVLYSDVFIQNFGERSRTAILNEDLNTITCQFEDNNRQYRVHYTKNNTKIVIQMAYGKPLQWYQLTTPFRPSLDFEIVPNVPSFTHFDANNKWWISVESDPEASFLSTDQNGDFVCSIEMSNEKEDLAQYNPEEDHRRIPYICYALDKNGEKTGKTLISKRDQRTKKLYEHFLPFETIDYIEIWQDSNKKRKLEDLSIKLPRYQLEFSTREKEDKTIEFYLKSNPKLVLVPDQNLMSGFSNCLTLKNKETGEINLFIPKHDFYAGDNKEKMDDFDANLEQKKVKDEFYPIYYDQDGSSDSKLFIKHLVGERPWVNKNRFSYAQYKIKSGEPTAHSTEGYLQLAYLFLAMKDTNRALQMLKKCYDLGGLKGTLEEILLINKIMIGIPSPYDNPKLYHKARVVDAETSAVRLYAGWLLAENKIKSFNKPKFDLTVKKSKEGFLTQNEAYQYCLQKEAVEFYQTGFYEASKSIYQDYYARLEVVPYDFQLGSDRSYSLLKLLHQKKYLQELQPHFKELQLVQLSKQREFLLKRQASQGLSLDEETELKKIKDKLKLENKLLGTQQKNVKEKEKVAPIKGINFEEFQAALKNITVDKLEKFRMVPFMVDDSLSDISLKDVKKSFDFTYEQCLTKDMYNYKKQLLTYFENILKSKSTLERTESFDKYGFAACGVLYYVLKHPEAEWPKLDYSLNNLEKIYKMVGELQIQSPLELEISVTKKEKLPYKVQKLRRKIIQHVLIPKEISQRENLLEELQLKEYSAALKANPVMPPDRSFNPFQSDKKKKEEETRDAFKEQQRSQFLNDLKKGTEINVQTQYEREIHKKYLADQTEVNKILASLKTKYETSDKESKELCKGLINFANQAISGPKTLVETRAFLQAKKIKELEMKDLIWLYLQRDMTLFQEMTRLDVKQCADLYQQIHTYLLKSTEAQHYANILLAGKEAIGNESALVQLGEKLLSTRQFNPERYPELLVFEYYENILIRKPQVHMLQQLIRRDGKGFEFEVLQLIMGGGKSKVLLPLLALLKAKGDNLSIIEVPASLFETNIADMQATTQRLFGKMGHPFIFDRDTDCQSHFLKSMFEKLNEIMQARDHIITTSESMQSLQLKYLELLDSSLEPKDFSSLEEFHERELQLEYLEKILILFKEKGDVLIDEIDTVSDPKNELNYTKGSKEGSEKNILAVILKIYRLFDKTIVQLPGGPTTLKNVMLGKAVIPNDAVLNQALAHLANLLILDKESPLYDYAVLLSPENKQLLLDYLLNNTKSIPAFLNNRELTSLNHKKMIDLAKGELELFKTGLRLKADENYGFPKSAAFQGPKEVAIPYLANNTPNEKAQFASIYEVINFTIQLQKQKELLSLDLIIQMILEFQLRSKEEVRQSFGEFTAQNSPSAEAFFKLTGLKLNEIKIKNKKHVIDAQKVISQNDDAKDYILLNYVLPKIQDYPEMYKSNSINHLSQFRSVQGITGTPWNMDALHHHFKKFSLHTLMIDSECTLEGLREYETFIPLLIKDVKGNAWIYGRNDVNEPKLTSLTTPLYAKIPFAPVLRSLSSREVPPQVFDDIFKAKGHSKYKNLGTDGQTIDLLHHKKTKVKLVSSTDPKVMIEELIINHPQSHQVHMLIDIGGLFKGVSNVEVAQILAKSLHSRKGNDITHILYFNEENLLSALPFSSQLDPETGQIKLHIAEPILIGKTDVKTIEERIGTTIDHCFTVDDQIHTTGTDIKQTKNAIGIATVDINTKSRDVWQGVMRLRQFNEDQTVDIAIPQAVADLNPGLVYDVDNIIQLTQDSQDNVLGDANLVSTLYNMNDVIRTKLLEHIYQSETLAEKSRLRKLFKTAFASLNIKDPTLRFGSVETIQHIEDILSKHVKDCLEDYQALMKKAYPLNFENMDFNPVKNELENIKLVGRSICREYYKFNPNSEQGKVVEVQAQAMEQEQAQNQAQMQTKQRVQPRSYAKTKSYVPWRDVFPKTLPDIKNGPEISSLNEMLLSSFNPTWRFSDNIFVSENYRFTLENQTKSIDLYLKPVNFFLVIQEPGKKELKTLIITQEEAEEFTQFLDKNKDTLIKEGYSFWIKTPHNVLLEGTPNSPPEPAFSTLLEEIQFFNADIDELSEKQYFDWLLEDTQSKFEFLNSHLFQFHPEKEKYYQHFKTVLSQALYKIINNTKVDMEAIFNAINENDIKSFEAGMAQIRNIDNPRIQLLLYNSPSQKKPLSLIGTAIKAKNQNIAQRLLEEIPKLTHPTFSENFLVVAIQNYEKNIFEMLLNNNKILPAKDNLSSWMKIINAAFETENEELIRPVLVKMKDSVEPLVINEILDNQLKKLVDLYPENPKKVVSSISLLAQMTENPRQAWAEFVLKASSTWSYDHFYEFLNTWKNNPPNPNIESYLAPKFDKTQYGSLLHDLMDRNSPIAEKLFKDPKFMIPLTDENSWVEAFSLNPDRWFATVYQTFKDIPDETGKDKLVLSKSFYDYFSTLAQHASIHNGQRTYYATMLLPMLDTYPKKEQTQLWDLLIARWDEDRGMQENKETLFNEIYDILIKRSSIEIKYFLDRIVPKLLNTSLPLLKKYIQSFDFKNPHYKEMGETLIKVAIQKKDYDLIQQLIQQNISLSSDKELLESLLVIAFENRNHDLVKRLLDEKVNPNIKGSNGNFLFINALENQDMKLIELLVLNGVDLSVKSTQGYFRNQSASFIAFNKKIGETSLSKVILKLLGDTTAVLYPHNIDAYNLFSSYLKHAIETKNESALATLRTIRNYGFPFDADEFKLMVKNALQKQAYAELELLQAYFPQDFQLVNEAMVDELKYALLAAIRENSSETIISLQKYFPKNMASIFQSSIVSKIRDELVQQRSVETIEFLLKTLPNLLPFRPSYSQESDILQWLRTILDYYPKDVKRLELVIKAFPSLTYSFLNPDSYSSRTPLESAISNNNEMMVEKLIEIGAKPKADYLFKAIEQKNPNIVKILLQTKLDCNIFDHDGKTPLSLAISSKNSEIVKLLLEYGADSNLINRTIKAPEPHYYTSQNWRLVEDREGDIDFGFDDPGARPPPEVLAPPPGAFKDEETVPVAIDAGAPPMDYSEPQRPAEEYGDYDQSAVRPLDPFALEPTDAAAAAVPTPPIPPMVYDSKDTPLMTSIREDDITIVKLLLSAKADLNAVNSVGETASSIAEKYHRKEIADYLKQYLEIKQKEKEHMEKEQKEKELLIETETPQVNKTFIVSPRSPRSPRTARSPRIPKHAKKSKSPKKSAGPGPSPSDTSESDNSDLSPDM